MLTRGLPRWGSSVSIPGTPLGEDSAAPILEANSGDSTGPIAPSPGPKGEVVAIVGTPSPRTDWQKPIAEYLRLGTIPDNETETRCLSRRAKGYLIQNNELYRCNTLGILPRCISTEEGNVLLLNIHEGIYMHLLQHKMLHGGGWLDGMCIGGYPGRARKSGKVAGYDRVGRSPTGKGSAKVAGYDRVGRSPTGKGLGKVIRSGKTM
jgi:hypothetical protein